MFKIVLLGVIVCSYSSDWGFGNHDGGGLTLGEISIDHHGLGDFSIGGTGLNIYFLLFIYDLFLKYIFQCRSYTKDNSQEFIMIIITHNCSFIM